MAISNPLNGTINPGQSFPVTVTFNSTGLQSPSSNGVGYQFYMQYSGIQNLFYPSTFTDQMRNFFYSPRVIYNW
jgi:hypothetical protein